MIFCFGQEHFIDLYSFHWTVVCTINILEIFQLVQAFYPKVKIAIKANIYGEIMMRLRKHWDFVSIKINKVSGYKGLIIMVQSHVPYSRLYHELWVYVPSDIYY